MRALRKLKNVEVLQAKDDADTLIAKTALEMSYNHPVEVRAEDTDVLFLLIGHFQPRNNDITFITSKVKVHTLYVKLCLN